MTWKFYFTSGGWEIKKSIIKISLILLIFTVSSTLYSQKFELIKSINTPNPDYLCFSNDAKLLAISCCEGINIYSLPNCNKIITIEENNVNAIKFSSHNNFFACINSIENKGSILEIFELPVFSLIKLLQRVILR